MILIFGGAYQGKTKFALEKFNYTQENIYQCSETADICFDFQIINSLHSYILGAVKRNEDPINYIVKNINKLKDKIIICDDVCCGIVPLGKDIRLFRDHTGKIMQILCREADEVYRVFCGLGDKIK